MLGADNYYAQSPPLRFILQRIYKLQAFDLSYHKLYNKSKTYNSASEVTTLWRYTNGFYYYYYYYYFFFDPGTQFPRKEKITLCNIKKSTKIKLE